MKKLFVTFLLLFLGIAHAGLESPRDRGGWYTRDGARVPNTDARKSINGFGGWLVITPDKDWQEKWETPPDVTPHFSESNKVTYGNQLTLLIFYINPKLDDTGYIKLNCDIRITRPDGSFSIDAKDLDCGSGKFAGNPGNVRLSSTIVKFIAEESDPTGKWLIDVTLTDRHRQTRIPLKSHFTLSR